MQRSIITIFISSLFVFSALSLAAAADEVPFWCALGTKVSYHDMAVGSMSLECLDIHVDSMGSGVGTNADADPYIKFIKDWTKTQLADQNIRSYLTSTCADQRAAGDFLLNHAKISRAAESVYYELGDLASQHPEILKDTKKFGAFQKCLIGLIKYEFLSQEKSICGQ